MREYTEAELRNRGYEEVRLSDRTYLGGDYKGGGQLLFKRVEGQDAYVIHGARDINGKIYGECSGIEELTEDLEELEELESVLNGETIRV